MNYKIDIDVIYGIKPRKYQDGGSIVGNNNTPLYSGEGWHSNLLIPNFRAPYILYFVNPNNRENTYVLLSAARDANLPFVADTASPESGAYFDYSPNTLVGGEPMDPNTTYLAVDPYGRVINTSAASIVLNGKDMIPIDNTWVFHPRVGWLQPNTDNGEITNPDTELTRNFLGNTLGWEQAYRVPQQTVSNMGDATAVAMAQNAAGILGGEVIGAAANLVRPLGSLAPRIVTGGTTVGVPAIAGAVEAKQDVLDNPIGGYLSLVKSFGPRDYDLLVEKLGEKNAQEEMLNWLSNNGYNIIDNDDGTISVEKGFYIHPDEGPFLDFILGPGNMYIATAIGKAMYNNKKARTREGKGSKWRTPDGKRTKAGVVKNIIGWGINGATYGALLYWWLNLHKLNEKASDLIDLLVKHGVITPKSLVNYLVQTDQTGNPIIKDSVSNNQMQDSAATAIPYNEGQTGSEQDSINQDYYGWENDTAQ